MQHLADVLLEELQQQGESEDRRRAKEDRTSEEGGRGVGVLSRVSPKEEDFFPFPSPSVGSPPPRPSEEGAGAHFRRQRPSLKLPGGLPENPFESTVSVERQGSGQAEARPPPWSSASSSIPPQFLGGRTGSNANILVGTPESSGKNYMKAQLEVLLKSQPAPAVLTPATEKSHYSYAEISSSSEESAASSFMAIGIRREPDTRLLKRKSKPSQHLIQRPSVLQNSSTPDGKRSPSFYKPKVVEDTGYVESTTAHIQASFSPVRPMMSLTLPELLRSKTAAQASPTPLKRVQSLMPQLRPPLPQQLRFEDLEPDTPKPTPPAPKPKNRPRKLSLPCNHQSAFTFDTDKGFVAGPPTPNDPRPGTPQILKLDLDSLRPEVRQQDTSTPVEHQASPPARKQSRLLSIFRKVSTTNKAAERIAAGSDSSSLSLPTQQKHSPPPATPGIMIHGPDEPLKRRKSSRSSLGLPPYFARPRYGSSKNSDDSSLPKSPRASPLGTVDEDEKNLPKVPRFGGRTRGHNRSSSEQLSPMTTSRPAMSKPRHQHVLKPRHQHTLENLRDESMLTPPPPPMAGEDEDFEMASLNSRARGKVPEPMLPSPAPVVKTTPPLGVDTIDMAVVAAQNAAIKKRASVFRGFLQDVRRMSSVDKISLEMIKPRKLKRKRTQGSAATLGSIPAAAAAAAAAAVGEKPTATDGGNNTSTSKQPTTSPAANLGPINFATTTPTTNPLVTPSSLKITHFDTTPFTQRYHDARKTEQQQIRTLIETGLDSDSDSASSSDDIILGFEENVPEHFPNSPLCPLHPRHRSGGRAICPQHRRYVRRGRVVKVGPARGGRVVDWVRIAPVGVDGSREARRRFGSDGAFNADADADGVGLEMVRRGRTRTRTRRRG